MPCTTIVEKTAESRALAKRGLDTLKERLASGAASIVIDPRTGAIAFRGWRASDVGLSDVCAFRRMMSAPEYRETTLKALKAAEKLARRAYSPAALAAGHHSHDGGNTWGKD